MSKQHVVIATRASPLAMRQAETVKTALMAVYPTLAIELLSITTEADKRLDMSLLDMGGKSLFVKELEEALLDGRADMAVHSMKDVPMVLPRGLAVPVITKREEARDVFISNDYVSFAELPRGAKVGTSSLRRQTQLRSLRADLDYQPLRGNIHTRLKRLDDRHYAAIILAAAGLLRMGLAARIRSYLSDDVLLPAAGQGALGIECRADDEATIALITPLNDKITAQCVMAERAMCRRLGGGCKVPVAAFAEIHQEQLSLRGLVANRDGRSILRVKCAGKSEHAENIGEQVAQELIALGATDILREF